MVDVVEPAQEVLVDRRKIEAYVINSPNNFDSSSGLASVSEGIAALIASNSIFILDSLVNRIMHSKITIIREFDE